VRSNPLEDVVVKCFKAFLSTAIQGGIFLSCATTWDIPGKEPLFLLILIVTVIPLSFEIKENCPYDYRHNRYLNLKTRFTYVVEYKAVPLYPYLPQDELWDYTPNFFQESLSF
jgi:hypothetical protein